MSDSKLTPSEVKFWKRVFVAAVGGPSWTPSACRDLSDEAISMLRARQLRSPPVPLEIIREMVAQHDAAMEGLRILIAKVYPDATVSSGVPYEIRSHMSTALRTLDTLKDAIFTEPA